MNRFFYLKLACQNIKKNSKMFIPYILTSSLLVMMFYVMVALANHSDFVGRQRGTLLSLGVPIIGIFAVIFMFYTNSFIIKQRKSEFGLYNILGMEKHHISRTLFYETLLLAIFSITVGILVGMLFGQFIFLFLVRLVDALPTMKFEYDISFVKATVLLFLAIFGSTCVYNVAQIQLSKPIDLLKSKSEGEKEPKTKWLIALLGIVALFSGYAIALWVSNPIDSMAFFFVAVILVIIGTYCLFTAGSIALLKILRKNKRYYYKTNHFVSVSNMIYRMKKNAVGLASICILSTMVLVMMFSTTALYAGIEEVVHKQAPHDVNVSYGNESYVLSQKVDRQMIDYFEEIHVDDFSRGFYLPVVMDFDGNRVIEKQPIQSNYKQYYYVNIVMDQEAHLQDKEALVYFDNLEFDTLQVGDLLYQTKKMEKEKTFTYPVENLYYDLGFKGIGYIALKDEQAIEELRNELLQSGYTYVPDPSYRYYFDTDLNEEKLETMNAKFHEIFDSVKSDTGYSYSIQFQDEVRRDCYDIFGSFFFLGVFLSILFMIATTLIMYYKQMSEGLEDKRRYEILMSVGMSKKEIKKSIDSQILLVFFLPLVTAGIHIMFSYNIIFLLFKMFAMDNQTLFISVMALVYVIFAIFYYVIYQLTARAYYRIVS